VISALLALRIFVVTSQAMTIGKRAAFLCIRGDALGGVLLIALWTWCDYSDIFVAL